MNFELVRFQDLYHHINQRDLFFDLSGSIYTADKIGIIGQNGAGKTTFLKMILGEVKPYRGTIKVATKNIGYIPQILNETVLSNTYSLSIYDFCMNLNSKVSESYQQMSRYEKGFELNNNKYLHALGEFQEYGGYEYQNELNLLLSIAGFSKESYEQSFATLSEGQKRLVYIISMMALEKDLLIMDEPTNHVDSELKAKYIKLIQEYKGAILAVSHDRELLSAACNKIWEIEEKTLHTYNGNWELYKVERDLRLKTRIAKNKQDLKEKSRLEDLLRRIKLGEADAGKNGSKLRMVNKRLDRHEDQMARITPTEKKDFIKGTIKYSGKYSQFLLRLKDFNMSILGKKKISGLNIELKYGDKVALIGGNGVGKSSLLKILLNKCEYASYEGEIKIGDSAKIGYFSQTLELGNENLTLSQYLSKTYQLGANQIYGMLDKYLFEKEQYDQQIYELSGGEKNRLQLMNLIEGNYNFLFLDEPTNHLDIHAIEKLEELLQNFNGSILLISHDKYFVEAVTDYKINLNDYRADGKKEI